MYVSTNGKETCLSPTTPGLPHGGSAQRMAIKQGPRGWAAKCCSPQLVVCGVLMLLSHLPRA